MEGNRAYAARSPPLTHQAFTGYTNYPILTQQDFCMSRPGVTGIPDPRSDISGRAHSVSQPIPTGGQQYFPSTTYVQIAPVQAREPTTVADDWDFRPDPNIEGRWIAVLQSHSGPPIQHQSTQVGYPVHLSEPVHAFHYQV